MTRSGRAPPGGTRRLGRAVLAYLVVLIRLCGAETAIEHDELGGAVGILDGCDTAEVRPPAHLRDEIGTRGCDSHRALPQGHGGRGALSTSVPWGGGHREAPPAPPARARHLVHTAMAGDPMQIASEAVGAEGEWGADGHEDKTRRMDDSGRRQPSPAGDAADSPSTGEGECRKIKFRRTAD